VLEWRARPRAAADRRDVVPTPVSTGLTVMAEMMEADAAMPSVPGRDSTAPLLRVVGLQVEYVTPHATVRAVNRVSLTLQRGEILGVVGESGCGKSTVALAIPQLLHGVGRITAGEIVLGGQDLLKLSAGQMTAVRGRMIGTIFQDPMVSLNPTLTIGYQIAEPMRLHLGLSRRDCRAKAADLLAEVGIPDPKRMLAAYPYQLSGGMRQRVVISIALACDPSLIIADEPTTAVDVTIQAQILDKILSVCAKHGSAVLFITHNMGVAAGICDRVSVMYAGEIVESAPVEQLFGEPRMPYTQGLLTCLLRVDDSLEKPILPILGRPVDLSALPEGCCFAERCSHVRNVCRADHPPLTLRGAARWARCFATDKAGWLN
jgi:oligopeptide/dipeptide ABC transporter ATP-binding protein